MASEDYFRSYRPESDRRPDPRASSCYYGFPIYGYPQTPAEDYAIRTAQDWQRREKTGRW